MVANYSLPSDYNNNYQAIEISIAPDGKNIAIGYLNGWVRIWDVERQQIISQFAAHEEHPQCCHSEYAAVTAIHFDGKFLTTVTSDGTFRRWDSSTQELITDMQTSPTMQLAKFSEYGGRLIIVKDNATTIDGIPGIEIVVPDPSLERLNSIAQGCISAVGQRSVAFATDEAQLSDFTAQIESLSDEQIPPGCKADLLAIIEAIEAQ
jgi:hypothetical protein